MGRPNRGVGGKKKIPPPSFPDSGHFKIYMSLLFSTRKWLAGAVLGTSIIFPALGHAATVNVGIDPELNPILSGSTPSVVIPDGTALFVVSYKSTQNNLFSALGSASTATDLVNVFSNQLAFFNPVPVQKGTVDEILLREKFGIEAAG